MAQFRQSGFDRVLGRNGGSDHVSIGIRASNPTHKQSRTLHNRRYKSRKISIGALLLIVALAFVVSVSVFFYLSGDNKGWSFSQLIRGNLVISLDK